MSAKRELERLQQEFVRLQRKYRTGQDDTDLKTPKSGCPPSESYGPVYYSEPVMKQPHDTLVAHLAQKLAKKEAETVALKEELQEQKTSSRSSERYQGPSYSGSTDFDEYLSQFMGICEYHGWTDDEAAIMLLCQIDRRCTFCSSCLGRPVLRSLTLNLRRNFSQEQEEVATLKLSGAVKRVKKVMSLSHLTYRG